MGGIFVQGMMGDGGRGWKEVDLLAINLRGLLRSVVIFIHCDLFGAMCSTGLLALLWRFLRLDTPWISKR